MNTYNSDKFIKESINSVLNQSYKNLELVIYDNCSNDLTQKIVKSFKDKRIKYILADNHTHLGKARFDAQKYLDGEYLGILDSDDIWYNKKLEIQIPLLKKESTKENPARVINIGSIDGINTPAFENYVYSASKAAVHHLTRHLSSRLVQDNILVNAIAPGPFPSNMLGSAVAHNYDPLVERNPMKRIGTAEDVGGLAIFLSSRAGNFTVGETIICDGGLTASSGHDLTSE